MKKILVIDDETPVRQAIRLSLTAHGHTILEAETGESGLAIANLEQPDLILSDVNMKGMSGLALLERLRAQPATAAIPVILMTGVPEQTTVRSSMDRGADDYLAKPFGSRALLAAVKARLERQDLLQANAKANEARLLGLLSATRDLIAIADPLDGSLLYLNSAGRKLLEIAPDDPICQLRLADFLSDTPVISLGERLARVREEGSWIGESEIVLKNGNRVPISEQIMAHVQNGAEIAYLSLVARDITERKCAELKLHQTHKELLEASRRAGMAEVATGVLHNVGNVLNSINIASACLADSLRKSNADKLNKVVALFRQHESDLGAFLTADPKGVQIPRYLAQLGERLVEEQKAVLEELARLQKGVEHIKSIVTTQQNLARTGGRIESLKISEVLDEAIVMALLSGSARSVEVVQEIEGDVCIMAEKHKVLQILLNLLGNAKQACEVARGPQKKVTIRAISSEGRVQIAVSDTGIGITPDKLERIFTHGFTTKRDGHGFGLYSCSSVAKDLGGSLTVVSAGTNKGATFTLDLPEICQP